MYEFQKNALIERPFDFRGRHAGILLRQATKYDQFITVDVVSVLLGVQVSEDAYPAALQKNGAVFVVPQALLENTAAQILGVARQRIARSPQQHSIRKARPSSLAREPRCLADHDIDFVTH